jgi:hypothetical protein
MGRVLGLVKINLDEKRGVSVNEQRYVPLNNCVPENREVATLVEEFIKARAIREANMKKELMEGLKLTPEEFIKRSRKEQAEQQKGEAK